MAEIRICQEGFVGLLEESFPPLSLKFCWFDESSIQIFAHIPSVKCPGCSGSMWIWEQGSWREFNGFEMTMSQVVAPAMALRCPRLFQAWS